MLPLKNYYFKSDYYGWQKFNGGIVPDGYELKSFVHCGLMIRKIKNKLNMWANRITLEFVKHDAARAKIQSKLDEKGVTNECITDLHIFADSGYIGYKVTLSDKSYFTIFDDGKEISGSSKLK